MIKFVKAERKQARLRLGLAGPSGSGKTTAALKIAKGMGGKIAVIDTERGSASLYADIVDFDTLDLGPPYTPERFIDAIKAAESGGYDILIIDSATHEWDGMGGCLEINETLAGTRFKGNTWAAWSETTPRHRAFLDAILQSKCHVIITMRSKTETVQGEGKQILKLGMKAIQRDGVDFELTTVLDLIHGSHLAVATKDRTGLFKDSQQVTEKTGKMLLDWLNSGAVVVADPEAISATPFGLTDVRLAEIARMFATATTTDALVKAWKSLTVDERTDASIIGVKDKRKVELAAVPAAG